MLSVLLEYLQQWLMAGFNYSPVYKYSSLLPAYDNEYRLASSVFNAGISGAEELCRCPHPACQQ